MSHFWKYTHIHFLGEKKTTFFVLRDNVNVPIEKYIKTMEILYSCEKCSSEGVFTSHNLDLIKRYKTINQIDFYHTLFLTNIDCKKSCEEVQLENLLK